MVGEDAGGLGYAAPSTGNSNYSGSLPASIGTTNPNKAVKQAHKKVPKVVNNSNSTEGLGGLKEDVTDELVEATGSNLVIIHPDYQHLYPHLKGKRIYKADPAQNMIHHTLGRGRFQNVYVHHSTHNVGMETIPVKHLKTPTQKDHNSWFSSKNEEVITSLDQLKPLLETYSPGYTLPIRLAKQPGTVGGKYRKTQVSKSTAMDGAADDAGILEAKMLKSEMGSSEHTHTNYYQDHEGSLWRKHAKMLGYEIRPMSGERGGINGHGAYDKHGQRGHMFKFNGGGHLYHNKPEIFRKPIKEELKVGEGQDNSPETKSRVKRKYLGTQRGRTATGKKAHAIEVMPVIQKPDRNINKTIPGSPLKRTT